MTQIFHTDHVSEFNSQVINERLETYNIKRSRSDKGTPLDHTVVEATYQVIKIEFVNHKYFKGLRQLELE